MGHFFSVGEAFNGVLREAGEGEGNGGPAGGEDGGVVAQGVHAEVEVDEVDEARHGGVAVEDLSAHVEVGIGDGDLVEDGSRFVGEDGTPR